ncbi:hypothetical protein Y032_0036g3180 [Ancylostoma ceylanicum]|nr:hypothetical protein Y032_0036g3180 [Ancylostoma ceylanicum]
MKVIAFSLLLIATVGEAKPLVELFGDLMKRHTEIKNQQLMQFIYKAVPYGIDPPNPKIAEYETFKSDKSANFLRDGNGNVVFRQFRRLRLADVSQLSHIPTKWAWLLDVPCLALFILNRKPVLSSSSIHLSTFRCCNDVVAMEYERRKVANELGRMEGGQREWLVSC